MEYSKHIIKLKYTFNSNKYKFLLKKGLKLRQMFKIKEIQYVLFAMTIFTIFEDFLANIHFTRNFINKIENVCFNGSFRIQKEAVQFADRNLIKIRMLKIFKILYKIKTLGILFNIMLFYLESY